MHLASFSGPTQLSSHGTQKLFWVCECEGLGNEANELIFVMCRVYALQVCKLTVCTVCSAGWGFSNLMM